jgi:hypothetical protein
LKRSQFDFHDHERGKLTTTELTPLAGPPINPLIKVMNVVIFAGFALGTGGVSDQFRRHYEAGTDNIQWGRLFDCIGGKSCYSLACE